MPVKAVGPATASTPADSVSVPATAGGIQILAANADRVGALISNNDTAKNVYLSLGGTPVAGKGITLAPGDTWECGPEYRGAVKGITDTGAVSVGIAEF
jgi:hypothetical protein